MNGMTTHALWRTLTMPTHTDTRGSLTVAEADTLPFTIRFTDGAVVLVMSSTLYAGTEYCRDYGAFLERVRAASTPE